MIKHRFSVFGGPFERHLSLRRIDPDRRRATIAEQIVIAASARRRYRRPGPSGALNQSRVGFVFSKGDHRREGVVR
jgi:hypothetical protein